MHLSIYYYCALSHPPPTYSTYLYAVHYLYLNYLSIALITGELDLAYNVTHVTQVKLCVPCCANRVHSHL